jgi:hypothetical protein
MESMKTIHQSIRVYKNMTAHQWSSQQNTILQLQQTNSTQVTKNRKPEE